MSTVINGTTGINKVDISAFNSEGNAPQYICRSWVNFQGTDTVTIRESGNVSSITDNGIGNYTVNFITDMPDSNYIVIAWINRALDTYNLLDSLEAISYTNTSFILRTGYYASGVANIDMAKVDVAVFR